MAVPKSIPDYDLRYGDPLSPRNVLPIVLAPPTTMTLEVMLDPNSGSPIANPQVYQVFHNFLIYSPVAVVGLAAAIVGTIFYLSRRSAVARE